MNARKALVAFMTFIGGLYFILEFVVPPTLPLATTTGIALSKKVPVFTIQTKDGLPMSVPADSSVSFFIMRRNKAGDFQSTEQKSREIFPGQVATIRTRAITVGAFNDKGERLDDSGNPIILKPGEVPFTTDGLEASQMGIAYQKVVGRIRDNGEANINTLQPGEIVYVEVRDATIKNIDRGELVLLVKDKQRTLKIGNASVIMRNLRRSQPEEINIHQVNLGDTISIGPNTLFRDQRDTASQFNSVIGTLALGMGLLSLGMVNLRKLKKKESEWYTSIIFFVAIVGGVFAGIGKYQPSGTSFRLFSDTMVLQIIGAMGTAIFSLLSFYLASAAYRAFRIRTFEAGLMMVTALIIMFGQTPFGMYISGWIPQDFQALWLPNISAWILRVPSSAFIRALTFGAMLGAIATALRYWLNMERPAGMGDD
jgi:hypothetical protein